MRKTHIAATIIRTPDSYVLHKRKKGNDKGELNKFGLYGGEIEDSEERIQNSSGTGHQLAASRELQEESGLLFLPEEFQPLGFIPVMSERNGKDILTKAEVFCISLPLGFDAKQFRNSKEMDYRKIRTYRALGKLTPLAEASFSPLLGI